MIRKHAGDIAVQHDFNQKLLTEHLAQLNMEDHFYRLSNNTESSLRQEAREFEKEWTEINQRVSNVENQLFRMANKLTEAKQTVKFDEKSLSKWKEKIAQKDEDNQLIESYMKQDTQKYKVSCDNERAQYLRVTACNTNLMFRNWNTNGRSSSQNLRLIVKRSLKPLTRYKRWKSFWIVVRNSTWKH